MILKRIGLVLLALMATACKIELSNPDTLDPNAIPALTERFHYFIQGKETSSLSEDRKTITLSLIAEDPDGGNLSIEWAQDKDFGIFNTTSGKKVQWTAQREGTYRVLLSATVRSDRINNDPDVATFEIPVVDGKINAPEMAPEITLYPQTLVLFRALPSNLPLTEEQLKAMGVQTKAQLVATSYIYDPQTNTKVKQSADFQEIKWTSSDPTVAVVDDNGFAKPADGAMVGKTTISAASKTNSVSKAACMVSVQYLDTAVDFVKIEPSGPVTRSNANVYVDIDARVQYSNPLTLDSVVYTDLSDQGLTWSSSNLNIAQVDSTGKVTIQPTAQAGTVTISAVSNYDKSKVATQSITVQ